MADTAQLGEIARRVWQPDDLVTDTLAGLDGDLLVLGAGGKMGISLCRMAATALHELPGGRRVIAVSRFSDESARAELDDAGVVTLPADILRPGALSDLPDAPSVVLMVGRKFGTGVNAPATWAANVLLPGLVARRYSRSRIVAFSSGNVYPPRALTAGGAVEKTAPNPTGEYAQTCLGRERVLAYYSVEHGTPMALVRLNYAVDCRYGVITDIARAIVRGQPVDLRTSAVNVIWQGDANRFVLAALAHTDSPPWIVNVTGPETVSVRWLATQLGARLGREPEFTGAEADTALLSNAAAAFELFGYPRVTLGQMIDWTVTWLTCGGALLDKPTHFEERSGVY